MLQYEDACDRICEDITTALLELQPPTRWAAFAAARATRNVSDALHHAAGRPDDERWHHALIALEDFIGLCSVRKGIPNSPAVSRLRRFLDENDSQPPCVAPSENRVTPSEVEGQSPVRAFTHDVVESVLSLVG